MQCSDVIVEWKLEYSSKKDFTFLFKANLTTYELILRKTMGGHKSGLPHKSCRPKDLQLSIEFINDEQKK